MLWDFQKVSATDKPAVTLVPRMRGDGIADRASTCGTGIYRKAIFAIAAKVCSPVRPQSQSA
jgi:hypothetical protein